MTAQLSLGVEKHGRVDRKKFLLHEKDEYLWAAIVLAACNSLIFSLDITLECSEINSQRWSHIKDWSNSAGATGPESLAFDPDGEGPYTGVSDGRIMKWRGENLAGLSMLLLLVVEIFRYE